MHHLTPEKKKLGEMAKAVESSRTEVFNGRERARGWEQGSTVKVLVGTYLFTP